MGIIENAKEAVKLVRQIDNIELYRKILDLQSEATELTDQLRQKDQRIAQLEDALETKGRLVLRHSVYYIVDEADKLIDGPFCTKCFDVDRVMCRVVPALTHKVRCQKCKVTFPSRGIVFRFPK